MTWISATLGSDSFLLFAYVDQTAGPSAKGVKLAGTAPTLDEARNAIERPSATVRMTGVPSQPLSNEWIQYLQLPASPPWLSHFSPPPWRTDPLLAGKFNPQFPNDIEATFILISKQKLEKMWVRLDEVVPKIGYRGSLLNTSHFEPALAAGTRVMARPSRSHPPMLWVPDGPCAQNLLSWDSVCEKCGFDLIFIPIAELVKMQFPDAPPGSIFERMTTRCLMCKSTTHVAKRG